MVDCADECVPRFLYPQAGARRLLLTLFFLCFCRSSLARALRFSRRTKLAQDETAIAVFATPKNSTTALRQRSEDVSYCLLRFVVYRSPTTRRWTGQAKISHFQRKAPIIPRSSGRFPSSGPERQLKSIARGW